MDLPIPIVNKEKFKSKKNENYTLAEDLILIAAWEHSTEDIVVGTDQSKCQYWTRIWQEYTANATSYPSRTEKSVQNRFSMIRTKCLKFAGILQNIEYTNSSRYTDQDKLNKALTTWSEETTEKSGFKFLHCYNALKDSQKWSIEVMKPGSNKNSPATISANVDENGNTFGHVELDRPVGIKAEKENKKKGKMKTEGSEDSTNYNCEKSQDMMQKMHEEKMQIVVDDTKKMDYLLEMKREKLEIDRKTYNGFMEKLELDRKTFEENKEKREEKLMAVNTSNLNDIQRKFFETKQRQIYDKTCGNN